MELLSLTSTESRYFSDLFLCCDEDKAGKVALLKATELFRSSKVTNEVLKQIFSIAHPSLATHLNRQQFYSCLKLIAAHQAHIPLHQDLLTKQIDVPLPRFKWRLSGSPDLIELSEQNSLQIESQSLYNASCNVDINSSNMSTSLMEEKAEASTDSEVEQNDRSECMTQNSPSVWSTTSDSPTPTNSVAERTWGSVMGNQTHWCEEQRQLLGTEEESSDKHSSDEPDGEDIDTSSVWPITAEQREYYAAQFKSLQPNPDGLLAGGVARMFFEKSRLPVHELRHIWQLSDITRDGALNLSEFNTAMHLVVLRRNHIPLPLSLPACLVPNNDKSCTSASENDVKSIKNDYKSYNDQKADNFSTELHGIDSNTKSMEFSSQNSLPSIYKSMSVDYPVAQTKKSERNSIPNDFSTVNKNSFNNDGMPSVNNRSPAQISNSVLSPIKKDTANKEWTKFIDSPTSSVSSPGPKPVNFDFHLSSVETDPKILHPVPLRVTPEGNNICSEDDNRSPRTKFDAYEHKGEGDLTMNRSSPKRSQMMSINNHASSSEISLTNDIKPIQRPQPKKHAIKNIGAIPPPPQNRESLGIGTNQNRELVTTGSLDSDGPISLPNYSGTVKKEKPPPPPPRQYRTHARSSSLDLNKLKHSPTALSPPQIPPRISPGLGNNHKNPTANDDAIQGNSTESTMFEQDNLGFADFTQFPEGKDNMDLVLQLDSTGYIRKHGAFEVYRKPTPRSSQSPEASNELQKDVFIPLPKVLSTGLREIANEKDKKEMLKKLQNQNALLLKLCQDLSVELSVVQAEKTELKTKLDAAKSFSMS